MKQQLFLFLLAAGTLYAQSPDPPATGDTTAVQPVPAAIIGHLADGSQPAAVPPVPVPERQVIKSLTKRIVREEPAPLPDMQPVRKTVTLTKQLIVSPPLPEPPAPLPPVDLTDPAVAARIDALRTHYRKTEIVFVSATVYDHRQTYLRWWLNGRPAREMAAWVAIDANLLTGFANYSWGERRFALIMGLGNQDTAQRQRFAAMRGKTYTPPAIPEIPADGTGYVVVKGDADAPGALDLVNSLVALYRAEQPRLAAAYAGREKARLEREASLRAHPPEPSDVTIWVGEPRRRNQPENQP